MKFGHVIGRLVLHRQDPSYKGGRFLVVLPLGKEQIAGGALMPLNKGNSLVVYDRLGAAPGDVIGYSESGEAAAAFESPTPVDAYNCAILDTICYDPPKN